MANVLETLVAGALEDAAARRAERPASDVERAIDQVAPALSRTPLPVVSTVPTRTSSVTSTGWRRRSTRSASWPAATG